MKTLVFAVTMLTLIHSSFIIPSDAWEDETKKARSTEAEYFVIKKTGEKIVGSDIKVGIGKIKIDDQKIRIEDVATYQDSKAYVTEIGIGKYSTVFGKRLRVGKISLYYYEGTRMGGDTGWAAFYILEKNGVFVYDYNKFPEALGDNKEALDKFYSYFHDGKVRVIMSEKNKLHEMIDVAEIYNR